MYSEHLPSVDDNHACLIKVDTFSGKINNRIGDILDGKIRPLQLLKRNGDAGRSTNVGINLLSAGNNDDHQFKLFLPKLTEMIERSLSTPASPLIEAVSRLLPRRPYLGCAPREGRNGIG